MKKQFWAFGLLACLMIGALACPAKNSPTSGGNPTNTPTHTQTVTNTIGSPTNTPTVTATPTACTASYQATYTFATGPNCWGFDGVSQSVTSASTPYVVNLGESVGYSASITSTGAWMGILTNSSAATNTTEEIHITFPCGTSPVFASGTTVMAYVMATTIINAQTFVNFGNTSNCTGSYENPFYCSGTACGQTGNYATLTANTWAPVSLVTGFPGGASVNVGKIGINVLNLPANGSVTVYIANVSISAPSGLPTATATPTSTTEASFFEGSNFSFTNWTDAIQGGSPTTLTVLSLFAPGGNAVSAAGVSVTWSAVSQSVGFQYTYASAANWASLGLSGFRFYANASPLPSDNAGVQPYCYSGGYESSFTNYSTAGWTQFSFSPPFTAAGASNTTVDNFGIQFATGGISTTWSTDLVEISNVELY